MRVVLDGDDGDDGDDDELKRWRLLVLEDCGEFLRADAKQEMGQGLSRLLNLTDGLLGQGLNLLVRSRASRASICRPRRSRPDAECDRGLATRQPTRAGLPPRRSLRCTP